MAFLEAAGGGLVRFFKVELRKKSRIIVLVDV
jgi:hypothetical protein